MGIEKHERLPRQFPQADARLARQRMIARHHRQQRFAQHSFPDQGFRQLGITHQPQIQRPLVQRHNLLARVGFPRLNMHIGIAASEGR